MKRVIAISILLLLIVPCLMAQDESNKYLIGIHFAPTVLSKTPLKFFHESDTDGSISEIKEIPILGINTGVRFIRHISDQLAIETGINYTQRGYIWKYNRISYTISVFPNVNHDINSVEDEITKKYHCIDVPIALRYSFLTSDRLTLYLKGGFSPYLIVRQDIAEKNWYIIGGIEEFQHNTPTNMKSFGRNLNLSALMAIGETISITDKLNFQLEFQSNYSLVGIKGTYDIDRLWNYGISFGLMYNLK